MQSSIIMLDSSWHHILLLWLPIPCQWRILIEAPFQPLCCNNFGLDLWTPGIYHHLYFHLCFFPMQIPSRRQTDKVQCYEPATMKYLGYFPALKADEVSALVICIFTQATRIYVVSLLGLIFTSTLCTILKFAYLFL